MTPTEPLSRIESESVRPAQQTAARIPAYIPLLLCLPALIPLLQSCAGAWLSGLIPTGFIQYDMPYYAANARQHFAEGLRLAYSNPYAPYGSPAIYFQPHILLLAVLLKMGLEPGIAFNLLGLLALAFAAFAAARLYREAVGWSTTGQKLGLLCFFWGGGLLTATGAVFGLLTGVPIFKAAFLLDPANGWWMLNFGRNLVSPTEAYYHGVFFLAILAVIRGRHATALAWAALLSLSHPFTGLSLVLILIAYAGLEWALRSPGAPRLFAGAGAIALCHLAWYQWYLNQFETHRVLRSQWELDWSYPAWTFVPALYLFGMLAFIRFSRWEGLKAGLADRRTRLFLLWFAVVFALTQHDLVLKPVQPIHFAHGYDWAALFLLASPVFIALLDRVLSIRASIPRLAAVVLALGLVLSDNLAWLASFAKPGIQTYSIALSADQQDLLRWIAIHAAPQSYVASGDERLNYLTSTYTSSRAWFGHLFNTPHAKLREDELRAVFLNHRLLSADRAVYYIPLREWNWVPPQGMTRAYTNSTYVVWFAPPALKAN